MSVKFAFWAIAALVLVLSIRMRDEEFATLGALGAARGTVAASCAATGTPISKANRTRRASRITGAPRIRTASKSSGRSFVRGHRFP